MRSKITLIIMIIIMYQEKEEEEDLPASKTALSHPYNDSKTTWKNTKED